MKLYKCVLICISTFFMSGFLQTLSAGTSERKFQPDNLTLWSGSTVLRGAYQNFGNICLDFGEQENVTAYKRALDIEEAIASVTYQKEEVTYKREYLSSFPDDVIAIRLSADKKGKINFSLSLEGVLPNEQNEVKGQDIHFSGKLNLLSYAARLHVQNEGGTLTVQSGKIRVQDANTVTILLGMGTNYSATNSSYITKGNTWKEIIERTVSQASGRSFKEIRKAHVDDYKKLFDRVQLKDCFVPRRCNLTTGYA